MISTYCESLELKSPNWIGSVLILFFSIKMLSLSWVGFDSFVCYKYDSLTSYQLYPVNPECNFFFHVLWQQFFLRDPSIRKKLGIFPVNTQKPDVSKDEFQRLSFRVSWRIVHVLGNSLAQAKFSCFFLCISLPW